MRDSSFDAMDLPDAVAWRTGFGGSVGLFDFVSRHVSLTAALALGQMLWPSFVVVKGCVLIRERFDVSLFTKWWDVLEGDVAAIESIVNHLHVLDVFDSEAGEEHSVAALQMAELIAGVWRFALRDSFPERQFEVSVTEDEDGPLVTFFTVESK